MGRPRAGLPTVTPPAAGDGRTPSSAAPPPRGGPLAAVATALTLAIVAGYAFVSATFTMPASPAQTTVREVFAPHFSQQWNVFAPNIMRSNRELQVQVQWREEGALVHSDWVDVTDIEFAAARGIPLPSRISKSSFNAAQAYMSRYNALSAPQQTRVRDTFIEAVGGGDFAPISDTQLIDEIGTARADGDDDFEPITDGDVVDESAAADASGNRSAVVRFLRYDYMLVRFASAFGSAYFDEEVERVRWRVQTQRTNDFLHRFESEPQTPATVVTFGWRQPARETDPEVREIFDDVVERYAGR